LVDAFVFSSDRRQTRATLDWSSDVCSSDLTPAPGGVGTPPRWQAPRDRSVPKGRSASPETWGSRFPVTCPRRSPPPPGGPFGARARRRGGQDRHFSTFPRAAEAVENRPPRHVPLGLA